MTTPILAEAVALHQKGQLDAARALYQRVLDAQPKQFDALHFLGVIARQQGNAVLAVSLISEAVAVDGNQARAHCNLGAALQDLGLPEQALASYERAVKLDPGYALAYSNRGNALRHLGRLDDALHSYDRALSLKPGYAEAWCNRAIALNDLGRTDEAFASAENALVARPGYADAWSARANALQAMGRFDEAVDSYDHAIALHDSGETHCSRGTALQRLQRFEDALASYDRAIALRPEHPLAWQYRANTLRALDRKEEAIEAYRKALALGGNRAHIEFALAAMGEGEVPRTSPAEYVTNLFDQYAGHFDDHLTGQLDYRTPASLDAMIRQRNVADADTLDLGCGTGLCAPYLRQYSRTLAGVDLSPRMLDRARERGFYDQLACDDIVHHLFGQRDAFDLIVAADVLVYLGDLLALFDGVKQALRGGGLFCFSVEKGVDADFALLPSNRYAHSLDYVQRLAATGGFELIEAVEQPLRMDGNEQVTGYAVLLRKPV